MQLYFLVWHLQLKITKIPTTANHTQQKEVASFYDVIKAIYSPLWYHKNYILTAL